MYIFSFLFFSFSFFFYTHSGFVVYPHVKRVWMCRYEWSMDVNALLGKCLCWWSGIDGWRKHAQCGYKLPLPTPWCVTKLFPPHLNFWAKRGLTQSQRSQKGGRSSWLNPLIFSSVGTEENIKIASDNKNQSSSVTKLLFSYQSW